MLNVYQLSVFLAVAERGSFSGAGGKLHLTGPGISHQIKGLEKQLGVSLFQREGRRMELTDAGRALVSAATQLVEMADRAEESILRQQDPNSGRIVIGCGTILGEHILPKLIAAFKREYPSASVLVKLLNGDSILTGIREMEVDFGLLGLRTREKGLQSRKLLEDRMVLIVPPKHPWVRRGSVEPEELRNATLILRVDGSGGARATEEALEKRGVAWEELRVLMEVDGSGMVEPAVGAGLGVALVPHLAARRFGSSIRVVELNGLSLNCEVHIVRNLHRAAGNLHLKFWEFIQNGETQEMIAREMSQV
ncbi:MAG: LysR family transcriptional regulator [Dehalococcoidia bacterium]|nr:LysR family transcriptional regulator [Dehalococcoidia bacterium]